MLFSDDQIARFINRNFEATWQNVRTVPIVTIDFGGGNVVTRTLHGNIATYVCTNDSKVLDVLPGIYEPATYLRQLSQFSMLHRWSKEQKGTLDENIKSYHVKQAETIAAGNAALEFRAPLSVSKSFIEKAAKLVLGPGLKIEKPIDKPSQTETKTRLSSREELARWDLLAEDTRINESTRRLAIHRYLAEAPSTSPESMKKWLYREVLDADLDDPYLGLGKSLFATYPFDDR